MDGVGWGKSYFVNAVFKTGYMLGYCELRVHLSVVTLKRIMNEVQEKKYDTFDDTILQRLRACKGSITWIYYNGGIL